MTGNNLSVLDTSCKLKIHPRIEFKNKSAMVNFKFMILFRLDSWIFTQKFLCLMFETSQTRHLRIESSVCTIYGFKTLEEKLERFLIHQNQ